MWFISSLPFLLIESHILGYNNSGASVYTKTCLLNAPQMCVFFLLLLFKIRLFDVVQQNISHIKLLTHFYCKILRSKISLCSFINDSHFNLLTYSGQSDNTVNNYPVYIHKKQYSGIVKFTIRCHLSVVLSGWIRHLFYQWLPLSFYLVLLSSPPNVWLLVVIRVSSGHWHTTSSLQFWFSMAKKFWLWEVTEQNMYYRVKLIL